jgi:hypothetical protein
LAREIEALHENLTPVSLSPPQFSHYLKPGLNSGLYSGKSATNLYIGKSATNCLSYDTSDEEKFQLLKMSEVCFSNCRLFPVENFRITKAWV